MSSVTKVKENASRIMRIREHDQAQRTEGCLTATCYRRARFMKEHGRQPTLQECSVDCCYHPEYKPKLKDLRSSDVRTRRKTRVGQYSALEYKFQATQNNRQEKAIYTDPSPF